MVIYDIDASVVLLYLCEINVKQSIWPTHTSCYHTINTIWVNCKIIVTI